MGGLYYCLFACTHFGNGTDHRTVTMAAPLLLTSGPVKCEAELPSNLLVFVCVRERMYEGDGLD